MEAQLPLDGFAANSPVGAGATPTHPLRLGSASFTGRSAIEQDHSQMPSHWCEFAGLDWANFPRVTEPALPPTTSRFAAFHLTAPQDCRVVIVGQDPYHGPAQAQGLSFSVPMTLRAPPSLKNILKELASDLGSPALRQHDLTDWASNGVLLLNAILSVAPGAPASHRQLGWQSVTSRILSALGNDTLGKDNAPRVFMLWGADAMSLRPQIDERKHLVLASSHPSPMGNACRRASGDTPAFFGSRPFSRANQWLQTRGREPIAWV